MTPNANIIVIGAGLAGIAASLRLARLGLPVRLLETRKRLGGRASSFTDPTTDVVLDQCQHAVMPACTHILDLYQQLGLHDVIEWHHRVHFTTEHNTVDTISPAPLPAPLHLAPSFLAMRGLSLRDKLAIAYAMTRILTLGKAGRERHRGRTIAQLLDDWGQPRTARRRFWDVTITSACNDQPENVDAPLALKVFQEGFLATSKALGVGLPRIPLVELYQPLEQELSNAGGSLELGTSVTRITHEGGRVTGVVTADGQHRPATHVITTVPPDRLHKLVDANLIARDQRLANLDRWTFAPIVAVHLFYELTDPPLMRLPHLVTPDRPFDWIFNKGVTTLPPDAPIDHQGPVQHAHLLTSGAHKAVLEHPKNVLKLAKTELFRAVNSVERSFNDPKPSFLHGRVIKEKVATFSPSPELMSARPAASGDLKGLYISGDWTDTGWPATMEGAVRAGHAALCAVATDLNFDPPPLPGDMPAEGISRWFL
ncbi:hydroxysqualene dehydroxylase HpnE [Mucisphaera calidilacus]|uniref:15-cis-phytoene desaturase n=1 Tax=Mucisphaera calidilacus TaxID=2527982 RepID=A0A518BV07_9BACT|nr:hydroxysqualene dehydroxylase HpnE [Mucisphaera calidilacus]QDU70823.1 15-cis-phytoene desaturase [Mucisphaera calidilacus]